MKTKTFLLPALIICLITYGGLYAQTKTAKPKPAVKKTEPADTVKKVTVKESIKSSRKIQGLFTLYQWERNLYTKVSRWVDHHNCSLTKT
jgi:hypothetical protein